jgi:hypothetical protein
VPCQIGGDPKRIDARHRHHGHFDYGARHRLILTVDNLPLNSPRLRERRNGGAEQYNGDQSRDTRLTVL